MSMPGHGLAVFHMIIAYMWQMAQSRLEYADGRLNNSELADN